MRKINLKENHIGPVISELCYYIQKDSQADIMLFLYKDITRLKLQNQGFKKDFSQGPPPSLDARGAALQQFLR